MITPDLPSTSDNDPDALNSSVDAAKVIAWKQCKGMRKRDAMRAFITHVEHTCPGWIAETLGL